MKTHLFRLLFCLMTVMPVGLTVLPACHTPSVQTQAAHSLKAVGYASKAAIDGAWELRKAGKLTEAQWQVVADFYDHKFQPAFRAAYHMARTDVNAPAPVHLVDLLTELQSLSR